MSVLSATSWRAGACLALVLGWTSVAVAVDPNPLENAYWRFEEGPAFTLVDSSVPDPVLDSINANHLDAFSTSSAPLYTSTLPPTPLKSGLTNNLALDLVPNNDLFTLFSDNNLGKGGLGKKINNGIIAPGGGFTIEAAFRPGAVNAYQAIVAKEGAPADDGADPKEFIENLPTFALKISGDTGKLQIDQFDEAKNFVQVFSLNPLSVSQWYYAAVVNDGSQLKLYLDSNDGNGYQLQGTTAVNGALFQGNDPNDPSWSNSWTIGRGQFGGGPADFFEGIIDEVRLSNTALAPSQFLFAPPGLDGDYNGDGKVDAADYVMWRDNDIDGQPGYNVWRANFGAMSPGLSAGAAAVPEPAGIVTAALTLLAAALIRRRTDRRCTHDDIDMLSW